MGITILLRRGEAVTTLTKPAGEEWGSAGSEEIESIRAAANFANIYKCDETLIIEGSFDQRTFLGVIDPVGVTHAIKRPPFMAAEVILL